MSSEFTAASSLARPFLARPVARFAIGFLLGILLVVIFGSFGDERSGTGEPANETTAEALSQVAKITPSPDWLPREVIQRQVAAMIASTTDPTAIADCFALASPSNRLVTGPLERFAAMVAGPNYRPLLEARTFTVGEAIVEDRFAAVLVTLMTYKDEPYAYRFFLSRQTGEATLGNPNPLGQYKDCWMTDGVARVSPPPASPALEGPAA